MMLRIRSHFSVVVLVLSLLVAGLTNRLLAQEGTAQETEEPWKAERRKVEEQIKERIETELNNRVVKRDIARALGMGWPVKPPSKTKEDVVKEINAQIAQSVDEKYPMSATVKFREEGQSKYKLYERGDEVSFLIRGGRGPNTFVKGRLIDSHELRLRIGHRWIARTDVDDEDQARFYEDMHKQYVDRYVRVQTIRYNAKRNTYEGELRRTLLPKAFFDTGYVPRRRELLQSPNPEHWAAKTEVLEYFNQRRRQEEGQKLRQPITEEIFTTHGYTFVEQVQEWMPPREAESLANRLKQLMSSKKEAEAGAEAGAAAGADDFFAEPPHDAVPGGEPDGRAQAPDAPPADDPGFFDAAPRRTDGGAKPPPPPAGHGAFDEGAAPPP